MRRCANSYSVFLNNTWVRFTDFYEAEKAEAEANAARINAARARGVRVIAIATPAPREPKGERERVTFEED